MGELQATLEISVEINKFYNIDLFQRGYYQIRTSLKAPPKCPAKIEVSLPRNTENTLVLPASIINGVAVSKTFQILYRNEDIAVNDVISYRLHTIVDSTKIEETLNKLDLQLIIELWFSDEENGRPVVQEKIENISQRTLTLHFHATEGVHHHVPVVFDYFHLSTVEVTIHGMLIALHQPYINLPRSPKSGWANRGLDQSTLEAVYFNTSGRPTSGSAISLAKASLKHGCKVHWTICHILLSSYEALQILFLYYVDKIRDPKVKIEFTDCQARLDKVQAIITSFNNEEEFLQTASTDVTQLCAENVILWTKFTDAVTLSEPVLYSLAKAHHTSRVSRFAEAFFTFDYPKMACLGCYEPSVHGHGDIANVVRMSEYFQSIPALSVECPELDGDHTNQPIIFEDVYTDHSVNGSGKPPDVALLGDGMDVGNALQLKRVGSKSDTSSSHSGHSSDLSPKLRRKSKKNFIKTIKPDAFKRPSSSYNCNDAIPVPMKKDVKLVGYRKISNRDTIHVELGTLSPAQVSQRAEVTPQGLSGSVSMPTLLVRSCWSRTSVSSMPDLLDTPRRKLHPRPSQRTNKYDRHITLSLPETDSDIQSTFDEANIKRQIAATDPAFNPDEISVGNMVHDSSITDVNTSVFSQNTTINVSDSTEANEIALQNVETPGDTIDSRYKLEGQSADSQLGPLDTEAQTHDKKTCDILADDITNALGEHPSCLDHPSDDESDNDDTNIVNGYDEVLDAYIENKGLVPNSESNANDRDSVENVEDESIRDIKNSFEEDKLCTCVSLSADVADLRSVTLEMHDDKNKTLNAANSQTDTSITNLSNANVHHSRDNSSESGGNDKVTIIELLREEYNRSLLDEGAQMEPENNLAKMLLTAQLSQKASSDSDITAKGALYTDAVSDHSGTGHNTAMSHYLRNSVSEKPRLKKLTASSLVSSSSKEVSMRQRKLSYAEGFMTVNFVALREQLKKQIKYYGHLYSEVPVLASTRPYFHIPNSSEDDSEGIHLVVCVHGLDGNSADLRLVRTYIEMALPGYRLEFLMSERNQMDTFADFEAMTDILVKEVLSYIELYSIQPARISFIGHSLGNIIIRSALARPEMSRLLPKLHTFLSLSGPHLGALYNSSGLVNMGMWFMQKWKKSGSLLQLSLKDHTDPRQSFLYKLSEQSVLQNFKTILLVGSNQDRYVPFHSSRIEQCRAAQKDNSSIAEAYSQMVDNILRPIVANPDTKLIRYDVFHALPNTANTIIGRAAHIAVLDSELFLEKFMTVTALKYFK